MRIRAKQLKDKTPDFSNSFLETSYDSSSSYSYSYYVYEYVTESETEISYEEENIFIFLSSTFHSHFEEENIHEFEQINEYVDTN